MDVRLFHANTTTCDLTIGDLHTYYVEAGATPLLVHNCGGSATADPVALQARVRAMTNRMGAGAFRKTVGGLHVPISGGGLDLFAVGAQADISEAQIGLADAADEALRIYPKLPSKAGALKIGEPNLLGRNHAEGKLLTEAINLGVQPQMLIASNHFCEEFCAPLIERTGGTILTKTLAVWRGV